MLSMCPKPECFDNLDEDHVFYALNDNRGLYGYLAIYLARDAVLHLEVFRFSVSVMRHMLREWIWVQDVIKRAGCNNIIATTSKVNDSKWDRLIKVFGFPAPTKIKMSIMGV